MHDRLLMPPDGFTRPAAAAKFAGVSKATMWRWAKDGTFPRPFPISPKASAIRNADLLEWAEDPIGWAARHKASL